MSFMSSEHEEAQELGAGALAAALNSSQGFPPALLISDEFMPVLTKLFTATSNQVRETASLILTKLLAHKDFRVKFVQHAGFSTTNDLIQANTACPVKARNGVAAMEILMKDAELNIDLGDD